MDIQQGRSDVQEKESNVLKEGEGGQEHRVPGRDSSGNFKKGKSGNPNGRPKGTGKNQKAKAEEAKRKGEESKQKVIFEAKAGKTVAEAVEMNSANLMNACFDSIQKGNPRLTEIFFTSALKDKGAGQNPFAGMGDFQDVSPEEIQNLASKINNGELDV